VFVQKNPLLIFFFRDVFFQNDVLPVKASEKLMRMMMTMRRRTRTRTTKCKNRLRRRNRSVEKEGVVVVVVALPSGATHACFNLLSRALFSLFF
jgi:hypothetical protein